MKNDASVRICYGDRVIISHKHDMKHPDYHYLGKYKTVIQYLKLKQEIYFNRESVATLQFYCRITSYMRYGKVDSIEEIHKHEIFTVK